MINENKRNYDQSNKGVAEETSNNEVILKSMPRGECLQICRHFHIFNAPSNIWFVIRYWC